MLIIYSLFFSVLENLRVDARITAAPNATPTATQTGSLVATAIDVPTATPIAIHPPFLFFPNIAFLLYYSHSIVAGSLLEIPYFIQNIPFTLSKGFLLVDHFEYS